MLAIRMQRTGRRGHAQFRVVVQDSRFHPTRGRVVSYLGSYNPHTKTVQIDKETAAKYLDKGAQPSDRVARLLQKEGVALPKWVKLDEPKKSEVRNADKRRSTRPAGAEPVAEPVADETPIEVEAPAAEEAASESVTEAGANAELAESPSEPADETPGTEEVAELATETPETPSEPEAPVETPAEETSEPAKPEQPTATDEAAK